MLWSPRQEILFMHTKDPCLDTKGKTIPKATYKVHLQYKQGVKSLWSSPSHSYSLH